MLSKHPPRRAIQPPRPAADEGLGGAADRLARLRARRSTARTREPRTARVRPYLHRAVAPDPRAVPGRVRRDARRGRGRSRSSGSGTCRSRPDRFDPPEATRRGRCSIGPGTSSRDQEPAEVVIRFAPSVAARVQEARWHPRSRSSVEADGSLSGGRRSPGTIEVRLWVAAVGRRRRGARAGLAPGRRRGRPIAARRPRATWSRGPMAPPPVLGAVNLISDPIHGYIELTKRLAPAESRAAGLPPEDVAEEDLLDTAWVQRLRRISQLQSARWVFPTAEHSRFTHGLGVMHEAGLLGPRALPVARGATLRGGRRSASRPRASSSRRCASPACSTTSATGRSPTSSTTTSCRGFPRPGRPAAAGRQAPDPRGPVAADHRARARRADRRPAAGAGSGRRARRVRRRRGDRPALGLVPRLEAGPRRRRRCRAGCAGCSRCCRACSPSTTSTTSGATPTSPASRSDRSTSSGCGATRSSGRAG